MDYKDFMEKVGVRRKSTLDNWLTDGLVPGAVRKEDGGEWEFSESSRRPHMVRLKPNADAKKIRASMVYACIKRHHICPALYRMSQGEFDGFIRDLVSAGLITIRTEDGWTYYDSTAKSDSYIGRSYAQVERFVKECLAVSVEAAVKGVTRTVISQMGAGSTPAA